MEDTILQTKKSDIDKLAIFDFDGTIVKPKEARPFPKDADDWQYTRPSVPKIIQKYSKSKQIVIVTSLPSGSAIRDFSKEKSFFIFFNFYLIN